MSLIEVSCELSYQVDEPCCFLFNIMPTKTQHQIVESEVLQLTPDSTVLKYRAETQHNRLLEIHAAAGPLQLTYRAQVSLDHQLGNPPDIVETSNNAFPDEALPYLNPSRYCESDRLSTFVLKEFGTLYSGYSRVTAICNWTYAHLDYVAGTTDEHSSACDVILQRTGVCRDYAHLAIALCRALGIPARYVSGYAVGLYPPDFHGFFEAFLGERWYLFDATRMASTQGLVRIGMGRDASDAAFATIIGRAQLQMIAVSAQEIGAGSTLADPNDDPAISTV